MAWLLVTPSSRGIGYALTRHLLTTTPKQIPIVATTRSQNPSVTKNTLLSGLNLDYDTSSRLDIQRCDLLSESSIQDLASYCQVRYQAKTGPKSRCSSDQPPHLRLALCIPGQLCPEKSPSQITYDNALSTLKLNVLAPMMLLKHFHVFLPKTSAEISHLPGLPDSSVLAFMSARVGSISDNGLGGWYSYRSSKAGVNQLVKTGDLFQKAKSKDNACVVCLHPGTVKTELSREFWGNMQEEKLFSPEFSAEKLCEVLRKGGSGEMGGLDNFRGRCWDWKGEEIPP